MTNYGLKCNNSAIQNEFPLGSQPDQHAIDQDEPFYKGTLPPDMDGLFVLKTGKFSRYLSGQWRHPHADALSAVKETRLDSFPSPQFRIKPHHRWKKVQGDGVANGVAMVVGPDEEEQESSFMNATLQGAGKHVAFSIATNLLVPETVVAEGLDSVVRHIRYELARATIKCSGLSFVVQVGASRDSLREPD